MAKKTKIAVAGAAGRMGGEILAAAAADADLEVTLAFECSGHVAIGHMASDGKTLLQDEAALQTTAVEVLIDFTAPQATLTFAEVCRRRGIGMVVGSTGFNADELQRLQAAGNDIALLIAQNMSIGINAMYRIAADAATTLGAGRLGGGYDIEISEEHHRYKNDAPSGTALRLGQVLAAATGGDFDKDAAFIRYGAEARRGDCDIGFSVVRGGDLIGVHRVLFAGRGEQVEIIHRSTSRANYVAGALRATKFIAHAAPGFYDGMDKILG